MHKKTTLKNGLRIITFPMKGTEATTVLVLVGTGSKYEQKNINGVSHFLEHLFFKGTKKRPTGLKIAETLDSVGGVYNAFTSKEYTGFWVKVASPHLNLALDWISDILLGSKLEAKAIKKERKVIIEEINMRLDTPVSQVADLWEKVLYNNQPAGWPIIGQKKNILKLKRKQILDYFRSHYCASNTIICVAGKISKDLDLVRKIEKYFQKISTVSPKEKLKVTEKQTVPKALLYFKKTDQTHFCLGVRGVDLFHPQKYAQTLLAIILGGSASSRLFTSIREKGGFAYYIHTSSSTYTDSGYLVTQAGVAHKNIRRVLNLILKEYKSLKEKKITKKELQKARDYLKGTVSLSLETSDARASLYATQELLKGKIVTPRQIFKEIDKIVPGDIQKVAREIFQPQKLNLALIGPFKDKTVFEGFLKI